MKTCCEFSGATHIRSQKSCFPLPSPLSVYLQAPADLLPSKDAPPYITLRRFCLTDGPPCNASTQHQNVSSHLTQAPAVDSTMSGYPCIVAALYLKREPQPPPDALHVTYAYAAYINNKQKSLRKKRRPHFLQNPIKVHIQRYLTKDRVCPEVPEAEWTRRIQKRSEAIVRIKKIEEYTAVPVAFRPKTPDPKDRAVSKRDWETSVQRWRSELNCYRASAELPQS